MTTRLVKLLIFANLKKILKIYIFWTIFKHNVYSANTLAIRNAIKLKLKSKFIETKPKSRQAKPICLMPGFLSTSRKILIFANLCLIKKWIGFKSCIENLVVILWNNIATCLVITELFWEYKYFSNYINRNKWWNCICYHEKDKP